MRAFFVTIFWLCVIVASIYMVIWPVPILPEAWSPPEDKGFTGDFAKNDQLTQMSKITIGNYKGPEEIVVDGEGRLYFGTENGTVLRMKNRNEKPEVFAKTDGRPLGMQFDGHGNLIVADGIKGLLSVDPTGAITVLADESSTIRVNYANNVDIASDGKIYFSDASTKFAPRNYGTYQGALYDLMEHGARGRILRYDPADKSLHIMIEELQFANGLTISHDGKALYIAETGAYQVRRLWIHGKKEGLSEVILKNLPGFPDNLTAGRGGRYWLALGSPRNRNLDLLGPWPRIRKMVQRLPKQLQPKETPYGHVIAFNDKGEILVDLQDPSGASKLLTSVTETKDALLIGNLTTDGFYVLEKVKVGIK